MKSSTIHHLILSSLLCTGLAATAPARADPPRWAPAHGHRAHLQREHRYVYYPAQQVYYEPAQRVWFWMNGGGWQVGVTLPAQYRVYTDGGVAVTLRSSRPYVEHAYVEEHYGRPWREQHRHEHHEWRERHQDRHPEHAYEHGRGQDRYDRHDGR